MFKYLWTDPAEMAVSAGAIVKHFDVVEDIGPGHITGLVDPPLDALLFQTAEEGFGNGVIPAVSRRLMLDSSWLALHKRTQSSLPSPSALSM